MGIKTKGSTEKPGDFKYHAANAIPPGWLECNGALLSRTNYAALFLEIGTTWGAGDGVTTFAIPDLRGEFVRGFDNGRGIDTGRVFGSNQNSIVGVHNHETNGNRIVTVSGGTGLMAGADRYWNGNAPVTATTISSGGGNETRPRNVAMLPCIKY